MVGGQGRGRDKGGTRERGRGCISLVVGAGPGSILTNEGEEGIDRDFTSQRSICKTSFYFTLISRLSYFFLFKFVTFRDFGFESIKGRFVSTRGFRYQVDQRVVGSLQPNQITF